MTQDQDAYDAENRFGQLEQLRLNLDGLPPHGRSPGVRNTRSVLFFAVLPDPISAARMAAFGGELGRRYGLRVAPQPAARLHVSLLGFPVDHAAAEQQIAALRRVGSLVTVPAFEVIFTKAHSFRGGRSKPLVLCCSDGARAALTGLRDRLAEAVEDNIGRRLRGPSEFVPHLTLAYGRSGIPETLLDEPIRWPARELVLVRSDQGLGRHTHLARWPFGAPRP